jgi:hypothetical protein
VSDCVQHQMSIFSAILRLEQFTFNQMTTVSALFKTNMHSKRVHVNIDNMSAGVQRLVISQPIITYKCPDVEQQSLTHLRRDIVTLPSVRPSHPCEHSRINILQWILTKLGTYLVIRRVWNPIDFQGQP